MRYRTKSHTISLGFLVSASLFLSGAMAHSQSFSNELADGKPWKSTMANGRSMQLTFNPDGSARMKIGIMSRNLTWKPTTDGLCLNGMPGSPKCVTLSRVAGGFVGTEKGKQMFVLTRN